MKVYDVQLTERERASIQRALKFILCRFWHEYEVREYPPSRSTQNRYDNYQKIHVKLKKLAGNARKPTP